MYFHLMEKKKPLMTLRDGVGAHAPWVTHWVSLGSAVGYVSFPVERPSPVP